MTRAAAVLGMALLWAAPAMAQETHVSVTPASYRVVGTNEVEVTIYWCGYPIGGAQSFDIGSRVIKANGVTVTGNFDLETLNDPEPCGFSYPLSDEEMYTSTGTVSVDVTTGLVALWAYVSNAEQYAWDATEYYDPPGPRAEVLVIAAQQFLTVDSAESRSERFTILNAGNSTDTISYTVSGCSSGAISSSCTPSSGSSILGSGASSTVAVGYTAGAPGTKGVLRFKATSSRDATVKDSSWTDVTVGATPATGVVIVGAAPGAGGVLPRSACVTVALAEGAAAECGDLRLVHALPSTRTMGTVRTPTLLYNSQHARPRPLVMADIRLSPSVGLPDTVEACIKIGGTDAGCRAWPGSSWGSAGKTRRVVVAGADSAWTTGAYAFTLEVTASNQGPYTDSDRLLVVNRSGASYGAGWWLAGLEQIKVYSSTEIMWMGGDGSARWYEKDGGGVFRASKFATLDSIKVSGSDYIRYTPEHAQVTFNSSGQHQTTVNSLGHTTKFRYTDSLLTKIWIPKKSGDSTSYSLVYSSARLDTVAAPGRTKGIKLYRNAARIDSIRDPDGTKVRFTSHTGTHQYVIKTRKDRKGYTSTFTYDTAYNRLTQVTRPLGNSTALAVAELKGRASPVHLDSAFTQIDGPRSEVSDVTRLWINGYGAPTRIRNALGQETRISYNGTWPGLADSVVAPNQLATRAWYNATRGLPDSVKVYNPLGTGSNAVSKYKWHGSLNRITSLRDPTSVFDTLSYNANGTIAWSRRGTNDSTKVSFVYDSDNLPDTLTLPGAQKIAFEHSALGNPYFEKSPIGLVTLHYEDGAGRPTETILPREPGSTDSTVVKNRGVRQQFWYDHMDRDSISITIGPKDTLPAGASSRIVPTDTIKVVTAYDAAGNRTSVTRFYTKKADDSQSGLFALNASEWQYDSLHRVIKHQDAGTDDWTTLSLDAAGNDTARVTPRGKTIRSEFDAVNRVTWRLTPQVSYSQEDCAAHASCTYDFPTINWSDLCIAADTARFQYDVAGHLRRAENNWAIVGRKYAPNGLLTVDTLYTRGYDSAAEDPCGGADKSARAQGQSSNDFIHTYVLQNTYDLAGRRTVLTHPTQLDPCGGACTTNYFYNSTMGVLDSVKAPSHSGGTVLTKFTHDAQHRMVKRLTPVDTTTFTYDGDGRLIARWGKSIHDTLVYDATGRVIDGSYWASGADQEMELAYSGLGALQWTSGMILGGAYENFKTDALGNRLWVQDEDVIDGVDRARYFGYGSATGQLEEITPGGAGCGTPGATQYSCHPGWYQYAHEQTYDASGNGAHMYGKDTQGDSESNEVVTEESRSYYAADEKLIYYNRHFGLGTSSAAGGVFEEYRYDALGRRVYMRSRRTSSCTAPNQCGSYVERTVWDGDQILYEIRSAGANGVDVAYMNQEGGKPAGAESNMFGKVGYVHAQGIDEPIGMLGNVAGTWGYLVPHRSWRGAWTHGTLVGGTSQNVPWQGFQTLSDMGAMGAEPQAYTAWFGSIVQGKTDGSGLQYMRNRYYDPKTGRFTQQDPIGLAGGVNLYGFADGDPVNFSDPFGLCKPWPDCWFQGLANWGARRGGALGGVALNLGAGLNAASEAFGTNDLGLAIGERDLGGAAFAAVTLLPGGKLGKLGRAVPQLKRGGKLGGRIDDISHIPDNWTRANLEQLADDLRQSLQVRHDELRRLGEDAGHMRRINQETRLLRQVEKRLSGS